MSPEESSRRVALARERMRLVGAELLLVDHGELLAWLGGFTCSETRYRALLLPLEGAPWWVIRALDTEPCKRQSPISQIHAYLDEQDPWRAVADSLATRGLERARIAVDPASYGFTVATQRRLTAALPDAHWVELEGLSDELRQCKSIEELALLRRAAAIADDTMAHLAETLREGERVRDAAARAAYRFLALGADSGDTGPISLARGDQGFLHARGLDQVLGRGDTLHVELIPKVGRYSARLMRPIVLGSPSSAQRQLAERLVQLQDRQFAAIAPGIEAREVDAILRDAMLAEGLRLRYDNVSGYSLGLYALTPRLSDFSRCFHPAADWRLEAGMVFHMYVSAQGMAFSETIAVTATGVERLTLLPRRLLSMDE